MNPEAENRLALLIEKHLDGALRDEEAEELSVLLEQSEEAFRLYLETVDLHVELGNRFADAARERGRAAGPRPSPVRWGLVAAATGLAALAAAALLLRKTHEGPDVVARLESVLGRIVLLTSSGRQPLAAPCELFSGQGLAAEGPDSRAVMRFPDGTRLEISGDTEISRLEAPPSGDPGGRRVFLARGELAAEVARQPEGRPLRFITPNAVAEVRGTRLTLAATPEETRVEVQEGRVRVTRTSDRASVEVSAGQGVVVAAGVPLETVSRYATTGEFAEIDVPTSTGPVQVVLPRRTYTFRPAGRTYYLAPAGNDANDGSAERPWKTFAHALGRLRPGDLLYVRAGDYAEPFTVKVSGTPDRPIVISAYPGERARILQPPGWPAANPHGATVTITGGARHVWIHGLEIEGCLGRPDAPEADHYGQNGITLSGGAGIGCRLLNNICSRALHCGIKEMGHGGTDFVVEGNLLFDNGTGSLDHGLYIPSQGKEGIVVRGNACFRNRGYGIHLYSDPSRVHVYNNVCFENREGGIIVAGPDNVIAHNVCAREPRGGLWLFRRGCRRNLFLNNLLLDNAVHVLMDDGGGKLGAPADNTLDHSAFFPARAWAQPAAWFAPWAGKNLVRDDPRPVDAAKNDFRLRPDSPCRGAAGAVPLKDSEPGPDIGIFPASRYR